MIVTREAMSREFRNARVSEDESIRSLARNLVSL